MRRSLLFFLVVSFLFGCDEEVTSSADCGDGVIDLGEECDTILPDELSCASMGYHGGTVSCNSDCTMNISLCIAEGRCGDGSVQGEYEGCEPGVSTEECSELGRGEGQAICLETCQYDFSDCTLAPTCGDGVIIVEDGEECDGTNLGGNTCFDLHYYGGQLACNEDCTFDTTQCALRGICGDGTIQEIGAEECDGPDLAGKTCEGLGFYPGGVLTCGDDCHYDTSGCEGMCGDSVLQSTHGETCDGSDLGGRTCQSEGFQGGTLACNADCTIDTSQCDIFTSVATGFIHTCATTQNGVSYCWGKNDNGQLGDGTITGRTIPTAVGAWVFTRLGLGHYHSCATYLSNTYCFGQNMSGQLGMGTYQANSLVPVSISGYPTYKSISGGASHTCGLQSSGRAFCWGGNGAGQLGTLSVTGTTNAPVPVDLPSNHTFGHISAGYNTTCALQSDGLAMCWGENDFGQVGDGSETDRWVPTYVSQGALRFNRLQVGLRTVCGLTTGGVAYCWGHNDYGQLGDGTTANASTPQPVSGGHTFTEIAVGSRTNCGIATSGETLCWGINIAGSLGDGTNTDSSTPVTVAGGHLFTAISAYGSHVCAIDTTGVLWCWGSGTLGQLGNGGTSDSNIPVRVSSW